MKTLVALVLLMCLAGHEVSGAVVRAEAARRDICRGLDEFHDIVIECTGQLERTAPADACRLTETGPCKDTLDIVMADCHQQDLVRQEIAAFLPLIKQRCSM